MRWRRKFRGLIRVTLVVGVRSNVVNPFRHVGRDDLVGRAISIRASNLNRHETDTLLTTGATSWQADTVNLVAM